MVSVKAYRGDEVWDLLSTLEWSYGHSARLFEACLSADEVNALKPSPVPYHHVACRTGVDVGRVRLVAAHAWDVSGALAAGAKAAFVARPGAVASPLGRQPDVVAGDIAGIADALLA